MSAFQAPVHCKFERLGAEIRDRFRKRIARKMHSKLSNCGLHRVKSKNFNLQTITCKHFSTEAANRYRPSATGPEFSASNRSNGREEPKTFSDTRVADDNVQQPPAMVASTMALNRKAPMLNVAVFLSASIERSKIIGKIFKSLAGATGQTDFRMDGLIWESPR